MIKRSRIVLPTAANVSLKLPPASQLTARVVENNRKVSIGMRWPSKLKTLVGGSPSRRRATISSNSFLIGSGAYSAAWVSAPWSEDPALTDATSVSMISASCDSIRPCFHSKIHASNSIPSRPTTSDRPHAIAIGKARKNQTNQPTRIATTQGGM